MTPPGTSGIELPHEAYVVAMSSLEGVGPARLRWLLSEGSPEVVWARLLVGDLPPAPSRPLQVDARVLAGWRTQAAQVTAEQWWERCRRAGVGVVCLGSAAYPPWLADDIDPPVVLFHRGDPDRVSTVRVGIVGSRHMTGYGRKHAMKLGRDLAEAGVSVVSGLALGIDAAAHGGAVGALTGAGGESSAAPLAIVGAGLDSPCPRQNRPLAERVMELGVVMSEVPPGVGAAPWRFPVRNRVIAAASDVLVVVESAVNGGSMHTVREAMDRDRTVLAFPGPVDSAVSAGAIDLIADGALVCRGADDVLTALGHSGRGGRMGNAGHCRSESTAPARLPPADERSRRVLDVLGWRPMSAETLAAEAAMGVMELAVALVDLERAGWVARHGSWVERVAGEGRSPGRDG